MGIKVESWRADDGTLFPDQRSMCMHEAKTLIVEEFPALKQMLPVIMQNATRIAEIMQPLMAFTSKDHPDVPEKTTPETSPGRITGWKADRPIYEPEYILCDCEALMNGDRNHGKSCSTRQANRGGVVRRSDYDG